MQTGTRIVAPVVASSSNIDGMPSVRPSELRGIGFHAARVNAALRGKTDEEIAERGRVENASVVDDDERRASVAESELLRFLRQAARDVPAILVFASPCT
jgi:hypothetical protein